MCGVFDVHDMLIVFVGTWDAPCGSRGGGGTEGDGSDEVYKMIRRVAGAIISHVVTTIPPSHITTDYFCYDRHIDAVSSLTTLPKHRDGSEGSCSDEPIHKRAAVNPLPSAGDSTPERPAREWCTGLFLLRRHCFLRPEQRQKQRASGCISIILPTVAVRSVKRAA